MKPVFSNDKVQNTNVSLHRTEKAEVRESVLSHAGKTGPINRAETAGRSERTGGADNLAKLLFSLKLPQDSLSRSIISFARFFSLPLESKLLASFRQAALGQPDGKNNSAGEARALGAAAAADKGIRLTEKALTGYAAAIEGKAADKDTVWQGGSDRTGQDEEHSENGQRQEGGQYHDDRSNGGHGHRQNREGSPGNLRRRVTEVLRKKPFLDLINRIPGGNGRWIVLPFTFTEKNTTLHVSMRILLGGASVPERLTVDAAVETGISPRKRWIISLELGRPKKTALQEEIPVITRAELAVFSDSKPQSLTMTDKKRLGVELAKTLYLPPERVFIREDEAFFFDAGDYRLRSVNKAV